MTDFAHEKPGDGVLVALGCVTRSGFTPGGVRQTSWYAAGSVATVAVAKHHQERRAIGIVYGCGVFRAGDTVLVDTAVCVLYADDLRLLQAGLSCF